MASAFSPFWMASILKLRGINEGIKFDELGFPSTMFPQSFICSITFDCRISCADSTSSGNYVIVVCSYTQNLLVTSILAQASVTVCQLSCHILLLYLSKKYHCNQLGIIGILNLFSVIDMMLFCETHLCVLQITTLANKQRESERFLSGVKQQLVLAQRDLLDQLV